MKEKMNAGEIIKVGLILFLITAVLAGLLAFVNAKTAPLIERNALAAEEEAMKTVMPDAADFSQVQIRPVVQQIAKDQNSEISKAFIAKDEDGNDIGACVITITSGYDVGIETVTGVNDELTVTGVDIISMNETPGLGANADNEEFRSQYKDKMYEISVAKSSPGDNDIQAIAGATKTSNGVTKGVNIALQIADVLLTEGGY